MTATPVLLRRRPTTVEAVRVTADNWTEVSAWCGGWTVPYLGVGMYTATGASAWAQTGDWVIHGPRGDFFPTPDTSMTDYEAPL